MSNEMTSQLFNRLIATESRADLIVLFRRNPGLIDTIDGIARRIGLRPKSIEEDLAELVKIGVLYNRKMGTFQIFGYDISKDQDVQNSVGEFIRNLKPTKSDAGGV